MERKSSFENSKVKLIPGWILGGLIGGFAYLILLVIAYKLPDLMPRGWSAETWPLELIIKSTSFFGFIVTNFIKHGDFYYFIRFVESMELVDMVIIHAISLIPYMSIGALIGADKKRTKTLIVLIVLTLLLILHAVFNYLFIQV